MFDLWMTSSIAAVVCANWKDAYLIFVLHDADSNIRQKGLHWWLLWKSILIQPQSGPSPMVIQPRLKSERVFTFLRQLMYHMYTHVPQLHSCHSNFTVLQHSHVALNKTQIGSYWKSHLHGLALHFRHVPCRVGVICMYVCTINEKALKDWHLCANGL